MPLAAQNVLMIGNSYSNQSAPHLIALLAAAPEGYQYTIQQITPGGTTTWQHANNSTTMDTIREEAFDHIIIQEQSIQHAFGRTLLERFNALTDEDNFFETFEDELSYEGNSTVFLPSEVTYWGNVAIFDAIRSGANSNAQLHAFQTWRRDLASASDITWVTGTDAEKVQRHIEHNVFMARDLKYFDSRMKIARVGEVWHDYMMNADHLTLYSSDGSHGNDRGNYLAACILYQQITGLKASENTYGAGLSEAELANLHEFSDLYYTEKSGEILSYQRDYVDAVSIEWACQKYEESYLESSTDLNHWEEVAGSRAFPSIIQTSRSMDILSEGAAVFYRVVSSE